MDLDSLADGTAVQQALATLTGRRTVPQVFIGGQHLGGCDGGAPDAGIGDVFWLGRGLVPTAFGCLRRQLCLDACAASLPDAVLGMTAA